MRERTSHQAEEISHSRAELAQIARRFYLEDASKVTIAEETGLSRFKIARLLQEARARGIVEVIIHDSEDDRDTLSEQLRDHLHLANVRLVPPHPNVAEERDYLGRAAAHFLMDTIEEGWRIGFSWGRTLQYVPPHLRNLPVAEFVQLTGVIGNDPSRSPIALLNDIIHHSGAMATALIAPLFCASPIAAQTQRSEPSVARVLDLSESIDIAFLSVGAWDSRVTQLEEYIPLPNIQLLDEAHAIADTNGMFFDESGRYVDVPINDCRISINVEQIAAIPQVVAVAGTLQKTKAIHALCLSGLPTTLITTTEVARALLALPPVAHTVYR